MGKTWSPHGNRELEAPATLETPPTADLHGERIQDLAQLNPYKLSGHNKLQNDLRAWIGSARIPT